MSSIRFIPRNERKTVRPPSEQAFKQQRLQPTEVYSDANTARDRSGDMAWMSEPFPFANESASQPKQLSAKDHKRNAALEIIEREVAEKKRDPVSKMPYGLYQPTAGQKSDDASQSSHKTSETSGNQIEGSLGMRLLMAQSGTKHGSMPVHRSTSEVTISGTLASSSSKQRITARESRERAIRGEADLSDRLIESVLKRSGNDISHQTSKEETKHENNIEWRLRALQRAKEQADTSHETIDQIVTKRWGSLSELTRNIPQKQVDDVLSGKPVYIRPHKSRSKRSSHVHSYNEESKDTSDPLTKVRSLTHHTTPSNHSRHRTPHSSRNKQHSEISPRPNSGWRERKLRRTKEADKSRQRNINSTMAETNMELEQEPDTEIKRKQQIETTKQQNEFERAVQLELEKAQQRRIQQQAKQQDTASRRQKFLAQGSTRSMDQVSKHSTSMSLSKGSSSSSSDATVGQDKTSKETLTPKTSMHTDNMKKPQIQNLSMQTTNRNSTSSPILTNTTVSSSSSSSSVDTGIHHTKTPFESNRTHQSLSDQSLSQAQTIKPLDTEKQEQNDGSTHSKLKQTFEPSQAGPKQTFEPSGVKPNQTETQTGQNNASFQNHPSKVPAQKLSAAEMNKLHARAMRAKLKGDTATFNRLMARVAASKAATTDNSSKESNTTDSVQNDKVVIVPTVDERGMPINSLQSGVEASLEREDIRHGRRKGKRKAATRSNLLDENGERLGYFASDAVAAKDDNQATDTTLEESQQNVQRELATMLRHERELGRGGMDDAFVRNIRRLGKRFRGEGLGLASERGAHAVNATRAGTGIDEDEDVDMRLFQAENERLTSREQQARDRARAIAAHKRVERQHDTCVFCIGSTRAIPKQHLIVTIGQYNILMLPPWQRLIPGHCLIVPREHIVAMNDAEEEAYDEANRFKSALYQMFMAQEEPEEPIFLETSIQRHQRRHTYIEVVPVPKEVGMDAPIYFRKAINEVEEWTTNRKLIDTSGRGLRRTVPQGFPYFFVSWRGGGFVHVVEDETTFSRTFGIDIVAGMLGLPPGRFGRKDQKASQAEEISMAEEFSKLFRPYDFTNVSTEE